MTTIRILLLGMPTMLRSIIRGITADQPGLEIVGEASQATEWSSLIREARPDVVIMEVTGAAGTDLARELLEEYPRVKVLGLSADGRRGVLHELRPHRVPLGELSPESLIEAIRRSTHRTRTGLPPDPSGLGSQG